MIEFGYDHRTAASATLWLLGRCVGAVRIHKLAKLVFFADRLHLAKYGRPIFGGRYVAARDGVLPTTLYADLWLMDNAYIKQYRGNAVAQAEVDTDLLSESDIEVLDETCRAYGGYSTEQLCAVTRRLKAFQKNWDETGVARVFTIPYEDFFLDLGDEDQGMLEIIREDHEVFAAFSS